MKIKSLLLIAPALMLVILASSCKKESETPTGGNDDIAKLFNSAETTFDDDALYTDDNMMNLSGLKSLDGGRHPFAPCATVTFDTLGQVKTRTIDFGTVNCLCNDGKVRRGKIIITISGRRLVAGSSRTTTYNNYFVDDNQITGTSTATYNGLNDNKNPNWTITVDKSILFANGQTSHWIASRNREWISGIATPKDWTDDVYLITGTASHTRADGTSRTGTIVMPLRREMSCHHFVSGSVSITAEGKPDILLDYGNGECDDLATITVNGVTKTIKI